MPRHHRDRFHLSMKHPRLRRPALLRGRRNHAGLTLLEVLLASVIGAVGISLIAPVFVGQLQQMRRIAAQEVIEAEVSRDLNWIKQYSKYWRLNSGPYNITAAQTGQTDANASYVVRSHISYRPFTAAQCTAGGLVAQFLTDANGVTITPPRLNTIATGTTTIGLPAEAGTYTLSRTITVVADNRFRVDYAVNTNGNPGLSFTRSALVLVPAAGTCP